MNKKVEKIIITVTINLHKIGDYVTVRDSKCLYQVTAPPSNIKTNYRCTNYKLRNLNGIARFAEPLTISCNLTTDIETLCNI